MLPLSASLVFGGVWITDCGGEAYVNSWDTMVHMGL